MATTQPEMRVASVMLRRGVRNPRNAFLTRVCGTRIKIRLFAQVMELVDVMVSNTIVERHAGSSPALGTTTVVGNKTKTLSSSNNRGLLEDTYLGYGAAWGGHLSGRQDIRSVQIRCVPPLAFMEPEARVGLTTNDSQVAANWTI